MKKRTIILVDDDRDMLESLRRILQREEYEIHRCESADAAWDLIRSHHGDIDVIISDNRMPDTCGVDFLVAVRKEYPDIVRIILTGYSDIEDAKRAINEGEVYRFLTKPVEAFEMELIVRHALAHKDLWEQNRSLLQKLSGQERLLAELERTHPGISSFNRDSDGSIIIDDSGTDLSFDEFMKNYFR